MDRTKFGCTTYRHKSSVQIQIYNLYMSYGGGESSRMNREGAGRGGGGAGRDNVSMRQSNWWKCARTAFRQGVAVQPAATATQRRVIGRSKTGATRFRHLPHRVTMDYRARKFHREMGACENGVSGVLALPRLSRVSLFPLRLSV